MGKLVWTLHPNGGRTAGVATSIGDYLAVHQRGWLTIEGCRAVVTDETYDDLPGWVRFRIIFDDPFPWPHA
jgi:hypothetical protein